jgi:uncharacterized protein YukJ
MTSISFTSGELLDIMSALEIKLSQAEDKKDANLAMYYFGMQNQFQRIYDKLQEFVPENRVANLVLAVN